jgi:hypothetical protein
MSADLAAWLRTQIEHRKTIAEAAHQANPAPWTAHVTMTERSFDDLGRLTDIRYVRNADLSLCTDNNSSGVITDANNEFLWEDEGASHLAMRAHPCAHAALNDPQDVIARCDAELAILNKHKPEDWAEGDQCCGCCLSNRSDYAELDVPDPWPCETLRLLASGYRHRPGYQETWHG